MANNPPHGGIIFSPGKICPKCKKSFEILNEDVTFSLELHMQSHKTLDDISHDLKTMIRETNIGLVSKADKNSSVTCNVCEERVVILNNDIHLSLQLHSQNHKTQKNLIGKTNVSFEEKNSTLISGVKKMPLKFSSNIKHSNSNDENDFPQSDFFTADSHKKISQDLNKTLLLYFNKQFENGMYLFINKEGRLSCSLCVCAMPLSIHTIKDHLCGKPHKKKEEAFKNNSCERKTHCQGNQPMLEQAHTVNELDKLLCFLSKKFTEINCYYITESGSKCVTCSLCNCSITLHPEKIKEHLMGKSHKQKEKVSNFLTYNGEGNPMCSLCKCKLPVGIRNIKTHIAGISHKKKQQANAQVTVHTQLKKTPHETKGSVHFDEMLSNLSKDLGKAKCQYVVEEGKGEVICLLCDCKVSLSVKHIKDHIIGKNHGKKEQIAAIKTAKYKVQYSVVKPKCTICDVKHSDVKDVKSHCYGSNHTKTVNTSENLTLNQILGNLSKVLGKGKCQNIVENEKGGAICSLCSCQLDLNLSQIKAHLMGQRHEKSEDTSTMRSSVKYIVEEGGKLKCSLCDIKLSGAKDIKSHIEGSIHKAKEQSLDLKRIIISKNPILDEVIINLSKKLGKAKCQSM